MSVWVYSQHDETNHTQGEQADGDTKEIQNDTQPSRRPLEGDQDKSNRTWHGRPGTCCARHGAVPQERGCAMRGTGRIFKRPNSTFWWIAYCHRGKEIR